MQKLWFSYFLKHFYQNNSKSIRFCTFLCFVGGPECSQRGSGARNHWRGPFWRFESTKPLTGLILEVREHETITEDYIVIRIYRGLHCDSYLQRILLWFPFTKDYIVIRIYKGLHCDFFYKGFLNEIHKDIHKEYLRTSTRNP